MIDSIKVTDTIQKIAVVIPTYKARSHLLDVINEIGPEVTCIYVVDDCCPDESGDFVISNCKDNRVMRIKVLVVL